MTTPSILVGHTAIRQNCDSVVKKKKEGDWISGRRLVLFYSRQQRNKKNQCKGCPQEREKNKAVFV